MPFAVSTILMDLCGARLLDVELKCTVGISLVSRFELEDCGAGPFVGCNGMIINDSGVDRLLVTDKIDVATRPGAAWTADILLLESTSPSVAPAAAAEKADKGGPPSLAV